MQIGEFLPRQFMLKAVMRELGLLPKGTDLNVPGNREVAASRIVSAIEAAADIFSSNDDPMPVPEQERQRIMHGIAPSSPEDLGQEAPSRERPIAALPQPPLEKKLLIQPDSEEARNIMSDPGRVKVIRPQRSGQPQGTHDYPNWEFNDLYATIMGSTPMTIKVAPEGQTGEVEMGRSFQADPAAGLVKILYSPPMQQKNSSHTSRNIDQDGNLLELPAMNVSIEVSKSFSIFDPRAIDFEREIYNLRGEAGKALRPRMANVPSSTPIIHGRTLEGVFSEFMRNNSGNSGTPRSAFSGSFDSV